MFVEFLRWVSDIAVLEYVANLIVKMSSLVIVLNPPLKLDF